MGADYSRQLYFAAERGDVEAMTQCLSKGGKVDWKNEGKRNQTALIAAAKKNHARAVRFLLSHGARDFKSSTGESALIGAAKHGSDECLYELLIRGSDHHWRSNDGKSPYDWAVVRGLVSSVRLIEACTCPFLSEMEFEVVPNALLSLFVSAKFEPRWVVVERARPTDNPAVSRSNCSMYFYESKTNPRWFLHLVRPVLSPIRNDPDDKVVFGFTFAGGRWASGGNIPPRKEEITCRLPREQYRWLKNVLSNGFGAGGGESFDEYRRVRMPLAARAYIEGILGAFDSRSISLVAPMLGPTDAVPVLSTPSSIYSPAVTSTTTSAAATTAAPATTSSSIAPAGFISLPTESIQLSPYVSSLVRDLEANKLLFDADIPEEFVCPITTEIMVFPVVASDGHSYSHNGIQEWMKHKQSSPQTGQMMDTRLIPNHHLRSNILEWVDKHRILSAELSVSANHQATIISLSSLTSDLRLNPPAYSNPNYSPPMTTTSQTMAFSSPQQMRTPPPDFSRGSLANQSANTLYPIIDHTTQPMARGAPVQAGEFRLQGRTTLDLVFPQQQQQQQQTLSMISAPQSVQPVVEATGVSEELFEDPTSVTPVAPSSNSAFVSPELIFPSVPLHAPFRASQQQQQQEEEEEPHHGELTRV